MCLITIGFQVHPIYPVIVAANRDEFYSRPSKAADFWEDAPGVLAGRDLEKGGTWLGVTRTGRFAALTNYREKHQLDNPRSRGELVTRFLMEEMSAYDYLMELRQDADQYNGFNLIVGSKNELFWLSNRNNNIIELTSGIHSISNAAMNTPWPKITKAKERFGVCMEKEAMIPCLLESLHDTDIASEELLPDTGVGIDLERMLSPIFIESEHYGTRASTVVLIGNDNIRFTERSFLANGICNGNRSYTFKSEGN